MPIYEYRCDTCGNRFEKIQKFSDLPLTIHDDCGGHVERLISAPAFHLKGTGWYATDYVKSNGQTPPGKDGEKSGEDKSGEKAEKKEAADKAGKDTKDSKSDVSDSKKSEPSKSEASSAPAPSPAPAATASPSTSDKK